VTEDPDFLTVDDVLDLHRDQIERYGGDLVIRDRGLIEAAVAMPRQSFGGQFLHADLFEMAAAYAFHLAESQAFLDGNKRTGLAAARRPRRRSKCEGVNASQTPACRSPLPRGRARPA